MRDGEDKMQGPKVLDGEGVNRITLCSLENWLFKFNVYFKNITQKKTVKIQRYHKIHFTFLIDFLYTHK